MSSKPLKMTDPEFVWTPAAQTDVRKTFARFGWIGPEARRTASLIQIANEATEDSPPTSFMYGQRLREVA